MALADTLYVLRGFPSAIQDRIAALPESAFAHRAATGGFSLLEHLCHLRDYELEGVHGRARRILDEDHPFLPDFNGDRDYRSESSRQLAFDAFAGARAQTLALFAELPEADLKRPATLGTRGEITLAELCEVAAEHDATHLAEIESLLGELR